jgi:hypothetical protein
MKYGIQSEMLMLLLLVIIQGISEKSVMSGTGIA